MVEEQNEQHKLLPRRIQEHAGAVRIGIKLLVRDQTQGQPPDREETLIIKRNGRTLMMRMLHKQATSRSACLRGASAWKAMI
jgi:hypothetical protein